MKVEIKKEVETREIEVETYIANDGSRFDDIKTCEQYEKKLAHNDLKMIVEKVERCEDADDNPPLDGGEYYEYHNYRWYRPKTRAEADSLCKYYKIEMGISDNDIGQWICLEAYDFEDVTEECWAYPIDCSLKQVTRLLDALGYDVVISERMT